MIQLQFRVSIPTVRVYGSPASVAREQHNFYNIYVTQRITRMPRLRIPMKDVASCDKLRSAARQALPAEDVRMGKPHGWNDP
jgi:hypothetical protein